MAKNKKKGGGKKKGGSSFWDSVGEAIVQSSPGAIYKQATDTDVKKKELENVYRTDPNVIASQQETLRKGQEQYGMIHDSVSSVGSGILGMFGIDAPSSTDRKIAEADAEAARNAGNVSTPPIVQQAAPAEEDRTLLYVGGAVGVALLIGGAIALSRN